MGKFIGIYFAFGVGSAALVVVQTLILWIFCSIEVRFCFERTHVLHEGLALHAWIDILVGQSKATRADGICDLPITNEFLRDNARRTHPQSFLQVCASSHGSICGSDLHQPMIVR